VDECVKMLTSSSSYASWIMVLLCTTRNSTFRTMNISVPHGREHLVLKTNKAFEYVYTHHRDDADWFLKVTSLL